MSKLTREQAEAALRGGGHGRVEALKALPPDVDPQVAASAALQLASATTWGFGRAGRRLPPPVIRAILSSLATERTPLAIFLRQVVLGGDDASTSVPDEALSARWHRALDTLLDLDTTYAWGSKQRRAKLAAIAKNLELVGAIQAVAVGAVPSLDMLAVLAIDGSEASADALLPHFVRAAQEQTGELERLQRLRTHASDTPAITQMLTQVDALLGRRNASSPALELARHLGLEVDVFWVWAHLCSRQQDGSRVPSFQATLHIDSRSAEWFVMSLFEVTARLTADRRGVSFTAERVKYDGLNLGGCDPRELPAWMAKAAKTLGFTWDAEQFDPRTNLRGKKRDRLREWLRG